MKFKEKNQDELAQMSEGEVATYFQAFTAHKNEEMKEAVTKGLKDEIATLRAEIMEISDKRTEAITKSLEAQGLALQKLSMKSESQKSGSILAEKSEVLKNLKEDGKGSVVIEKTMTIGANAPTYTQGYVDPNVARLAERKPFMQDIVTSRTLAASGNVIYFEQASRVGDAGVTGEGLAKNSNEWDLEEKRESSKKVTAFTKASMELVDDIPYMESLINVDLMSRVRLALDGQLLTGSGAGVNLKGAFTNATAFSAGIHATGVTDANRYDVIAIAYAQVLSQNFTPTHVLLNPQDGASMDVTKGTDGQYSLPSFVSRDGSTIKGMTVIYNNGIPAGEYLVFDASKQEVYTRDGVKITIGMENDDLTKNLVTVVAEWRGLSVIKTNHYGAFVKGVFATDIAAITAP